MAYIIIYSQEGEKIVELQAFNTIGRHPNNSIQILDRIVSKQHAVIYKEGELFKIRDLQSLNGTYINGTRITEALLNNGDEIVLGNTRIKFYKELPSLTQKPNITVFQQDLESFIRKKVAFQPEEFLPAPEIKDLEQLRRDYERLRIVYNLQKYIGLELNLEKLLNKIIEGIFQFLPADRGVIMLFDEGGRLVPKAVKTRRGPTDDIIISNTIINTVLKERAGILSSDAVMDSRFKGSKSIIMQGIRSSMAVPIIHVGEILGVIIVDSQLRTDAFDEKDLHLLTNIANQAAMFIANIRLAKKLEEEAVTRENLQRMLSPNLAEQVISGKLEVKKGGESRFATVLFADIRGFTSMSEKFSPQAVVDMLNEYFELMVDIVFAYEGTLDKFIGDAIMAIWGAPIYHPDDPIRAVRAAVDMQLMIKEFNTIRIQEGKEPIQIGIGINSGEVVAGYIGSSKTMEYSVVGDTVNVASRLCSLAKAGQIIISEETYRRVKDHFKIVPLPPAIVKGKKEPLKIYNVIDTFQFEPEDISNTTGEWRK